MVCVRNVTYRTIMFLSCGTSYIFTNALLLECLLLLLLLSMWCCWRWCCCCVCVCMFGASSTSQPSMKQMNKICCIWKANALHRWYQMIANMTIVCRSKWNELENVMLCAYIVQLYRPYISHSWWHTCTIELQFAHRNAFVESLVDLHRKKAQTQRQKLIQSTIPCPYIRFSYEFSRLYNGIGMVYESFQSYYCRHFSRWQSKIQSLVQYRLELYV